MQTDFPAGVIYVGVITGQPAAFGAQSKELETAIGTEAVA